MKILLPYGTTNIDAIFNQDSGVVVLNRQDTRAISDIKIAIKKCLQCPINSPPLIELLKSTDNVVVIVSDNTRACPDKSLLPVILEEIEQKVPRNHITIVIALGLHAPLSRQELITKLGDNIINNYRVENHDINNTVFLGYTSRGTPVEVYKTVAKADFRISTGLIEPHFFAGFSGGRKSIAPGVSGSNSIHANHSYKMLESSYASAGVLKGNPVHEDMVEQAKIAHLDFIVNVILNKDDEISDIVAGNYITAHENGCKIEQIYAAVPLKHKVDVTVITNGGAPLDLDLYQTCKGISTASTITRDGGAIIIASSCSNGLGPQSFVALHSSLNTPQEVIMKIKDSKFSGVQWQNFILANAQIRHSIYLLSELADKQVKQMMMEPIHSIQEGIDKASRLVGQNMKIAVIPKGPYVIPMLINKAIQKIEYSQAALDIK